MTTRRTFIKTLTRSVVAGGILGTGRYLLFRDTSGQTCDFNFPCKDCRQLSSCKDGKAEEFRKSQQKGGNG
jgi:hypothetical protein